MPIDGVIQLRRLAAIITRESLLRRTAGEVEGFAADGGSEGQVDVFTHHCAARIRD